MEESQIRKEMQNVINNYLKAIKTGDLNLFRQVFHPQAVVVYPQDPSKQPVITPIESFAKSVAESVSKGVPIEEIPRNIKFDAYRNIGAVRLDFELKMGPSAFEGTDFFNLVKVEGKWRIMQKIYDMVSKESGT